jgi:hypothetical protein
MEDELAQWLVVGVSCARSCYGNMKNKLPLALLSLLVSASVCAQSGPVTESTTSTGTTAPCGFYCWWSAQTNATQSKQPAWAVPLVTTYTGLFQVVRVDVLRQIAPALTDTWNYDNSKGVNVIIPHMNTEFVLDLPPYIQHNNPKVNDGAGDFSILGKYRLASGNAQHGAYTLSFWTLVTFPTGSYKNGSPNASFQPNLGGGKGFGNFDFQTSIGATLPAGNPAIHSSGRPVLWNVAAQYKIGKLFWPEIESNATFYHGGTNDGKIQEFITPGIVIGKCALHPNDPKKRPGLAFGGGMQIATSQIHTYNHELILTARWIY